MDSQQARPIWAGFAPALASGFVPRPESGQELAAALEPGATVALVPVSARGFGRGWLDTCGKTQLAVWTAQSLGQRGEVELVVWVTATSRASVLSGYAEAAAAAGTPLTGDADSVAAGFLGWLRDNRRPWLVVLDNLAAGAVDSRLWPAGPAGRVLITTADPGALAGAPAQIVPLGPFSRREALTYLISRLAADLDQRQGAIDLVGELGQEPLALALASAVIVSSELTCHGYREHFARRRDQPGGSGSAAGGAGPTAGPVTWSLSVDHAELLAPGAAQSLLVLAALLDGNAIPGTVLATAAVREYAAAGGAGDEITRGLTALEDAGLLCVERPADPSSPGSPAPFSPGTARQASAVSSSALASRSPFAPASFAPADSLAPTVVRMSWLVQAAVRAAMPDGMINSAAVTAADAVLEAWPAEEEPEWLIRGLRASAESVRQAAGDLLWADACHPLLLRAGQSLDAARLTGPAVEYWAELAATAERTLGQDHPETLEISERLARAHLAAGQAPEAVALLWRFRQERARRHGPDHPGTTDAGRNLGLALVSAGRFGDAVAVLSEAVSSRERSQGAASVAALASREDLAAAHRAAGEFTDAIALYRGTLDERERVQGSRHGDVTATRQKLAEAYLAAGQAKAAIEQYKRVVSERERALGPGHLHTIAARGALGTAYHETGKMAAAVRLHEQTRTDYTRVLGPDHPDTLAACVNLAHAYSAVGRGTDAARLLGDTAQRCDATLPVSDPLRVAARSSLVNVGGR